MNPKRVWKKGRFVLVLAVLAGLVVLLTGCISGVNEVGWSGGTVSNNTLFVGARSGRLVSINLETEGVQKAEQLKSTQSTGLLGCSPYSGCSGGSSGVAIYGSPVVSNGLVYIAGYNGRVYAYEESNITTQRWVYPMNDKISSIVGTIVVNNGKLFFGDTDGIFYCLDAMTGDLIWKETTGDRIWGTAAVSGDVVYIGSFDKNLYAFNISDGSQKWMFTADGAIMAQPLVEDGVIYLGVLNKVLYALNENDGSVRWRFEAVDSWFWATPVLVDGKVYAPNLDGNVYILDAASGSLVSHYDLEYGVSSNPVISGDFVIIANREGLIYAINTQDNKLRNLANINTTVNGALTAYDGIIYIQTDAGQIARVDADTGSILQPLVVSS